MHWQRPCLPKHSWTQEVVLCETADGNREQCSPLTFFMSNFSRSCALWLPRRWFLHVFALYNYDCDMIRYDMITVEGQPFLHRQLINSEAPPCNQKITEAPVMGRWASRRFLRVGKVERPPVALLQVMFHIISHGKWNISFNRGTSFLNPSKCFVLAFNDDWLRTRHVDSSHNLLLVLGWRSNWVGPCFR